MKYPIIFIMSITALAVSCTGKQYCLDNSFGAGQQWQQDSGQIFLLNFNMGQDDTIRVNVPLLDIHNEPESTYEFDEDCQGFIRYSLGTHQPTHVDIVKNTGNIIWLQVEGADRLSYYHRL